MEIRQTLLNAEMILKDFISVIVSEKWGENWINESGLSEERIQEILALKHQNEKELNPMTTENRLLNYCSFKDLGIILSTHWNDEFERAFGNKNALVTYLNTLYKFNNPDAYNRPLLSFEKHLILGVTGTIRNNISVYRSWKEIGKEGFPQIESVTDNYANLWTMGAPKKLKTQLSLRVGDLLEFVIAASDPLDEDLDYRIFPNKWQSNNILQYEIKKEDVGKDITFQIGIKSRRKHHAYPLGYDDRITFEYTILPKED